MIRSISISSILSLLILSGCGSLYSHVEFPDERAPITSSTSEKPRPPSPNAEDAQYQRLNGRNQTSSEGSIFSSQTFSGLFEDRRARMVGDLVTIEIVESIDSQQRNQTAVSRKDDIALRTPEIRGFFNLRGIDDSASSSKDFNGQGQTRANNTVRGTVAVVVTEVLPSGNLRVKGERQIGTNREVEAIKFYGIVNPETIRSGNRVLSTDVAEARLEYKGKGQVDSALTMGWLSRFFLTVMPF